MTASDVPARPARRDPRPPQAGWRSRDILKAAIIVAGVYLALQLLWVGRSVFLLGFLGVLFGIVLAAGVDRLERFRIPRGLGAVLLVLAVLGALVGIGLVAAPQVSGQMRELRQQIPQAANKVRGWLDQRLGGVAEALQGGAAAGASGGSQEEALPSGPGQGEGGKPGGEQGGPKEQDQQQGAQQRGPQQEGAQQEGARQEGAQQGGAAGRPGAGGVQGPPGLSQTLSDQVSGIGRTFFSIFSSTLAALAGLVVLIFVAIFVAADPGLYHRGLMHLFPHPSRAKAGEVLTATATTLRRWLLMQLIAMVVIGAVTTVALMLLGVRGAVALGLIAGILEFIPYVGPILSAVPAIGMGLLDGPDKALYVALAYVAIQQLEGVVLQPLLMKEGLELPPVLTILGQGLFALVFGFLGLLLAVPLLATVMIPVKMLYVRDVVGDEVTVPGQDEDD
jgi:predicted PurR-regulated permease PerM